MLFARRSSPVHEPFRASGHRRPPAGARPPSARQRRCCVAALLLPALLAACEPATEVTTRIRSVCVDDDMLQVQFEGCYGTLCTDLQRSTCTATLAAGTLEVRGEVELTRRPHRSCDGPCRFVIARCRMPSDVDEEHTVLSVDGELGPVLSEARCGGQVAEFGRE